MQALVFEEYGGPEVLKLGEVPEPHAGPGQVRIAVRAASVNPFDWKLRAGYMAQFVPLEFPAIPGTDAAGVVDEVGEGVHGIQRGDAVFGLGARTSAESAVLDDVAVKPDLMSFEQAAALGLAVEAAARALDRLDLPDGATVLIDGATGGVGSAAAQLAVARGLRVLGTSSPPNHEYLRSLGGTPTTYGPGLQDRVAALGIRVDAAIDLSGQSISELVAITGDPGRVATLVDFSAAESGVVLVDTSRGRATYALQEAADRFTRGRFTIAIQQAYPLSRGADAHRQSETGHVRGKLALTVP